MDKELVSEAGNYLKDVSSQGFEYYVQGIWVTSIMWIIVGAVLFILGIASIPLFKKVRKSEIEEDEYSESGAKTLLLGTLIIMLVIFGFITVLYNLSGVVAPEYTAIQRLISAIRGGE